jgi:signal transduction protein with GAF and PtsI domain
MARSADAAFQEVVRSAVANPVVESAALFLVTPGSDDLELVAAAGIEGPARDGLIAAVRNPAHPITRAMTDDGPTFDVRPMNPGGPALRSHLPVVALRDGRPAVVGVLAVAHAEALSAGQREQLTRLAEDAAAAATD